MTAAAAKDSVAMVIKHCIWFIWICVLTRSECSNSKLRMKCFVYVRFFLLFVCLFEALCENNVDKRCLLFNAIDFNFIAHISYWNVSFWLKFCNTLQLLSLWLHQTLKFRWFRYYNNRVMGSRAQKLLSKMIQFTYFNGFTVLFSVARVSEWRSP